VIEHKVHDGAVRLMALSEDRIVTSDGDYVTRVFNYPTCLYVFQNVITNDGN
jgi:hypothetical protein